MGYLRVPFHTITWLTYTWLTYAVNLIDVVSLRGWEMDAMTWITLRRIPGAIAEVVTWAIFGTIFGSIFGSIFRAIFRAIFGASSWPEQRWGRRCWQGGLALGLSGAIALGVAVPRAAAEFCRTLGANQICIVEIHRSAKQYWEYRAKVRINGQMRAIARYNCRTRVWTDRRGKAHDFEPDGAGQLICNTLQGQ